MTTQEKNVCGSCRYFASDNKCHANPPTVAGTSEWVDSYYPAVKPDAIACRFFKESEAATDARIRAHFAALDARGAA